MLTGSFWFVNPYIIFQDIRNSCEPSMFSLERLIVAISEDVRTPYHVLMKVLPALNKVIQMEKQNREVLFNMGLKVRFYRIYLFRLILLFKSPKRHSTH